MAHKWRLYGTLGCHLCEQAISIIRQLQQDFTIDCEHVDISEQEVWVIAMGERIPVLEDAATGMQIDWPFNPQTLTQWLS